MKFLFDECCDSSLVEHMRAEGYRVDYIKEMKPGSSDREILHQAKNEKWILVTEDKDFGELVYRLKKPAYSVILLRFHPLEKIKKKLQMSHLAENYSSKMPGNFVVADTEKIRIRALRQ